MKLTALVLLLTALLTLVEAPAQAYASAPSELTVKAKEEAIFKRKRKGYRRKRGFLWGLFRKKDCGCPNH